MSSSINFESRVKTEPAFFASQGKPVSPNFFKQEKTLGEGLHEGNGYNVRNFAAQRLTTHSFLACDRNGNNLLMIAPVAGTNTLKGDSRPLGPFVAGLPARQNGTGIGQGVSLNCGGGHLKRLKVEASDQDDQPGQSKRSSPISHSGGIHSVRKRARVTLSKDPISFRTSELKNVHRK